jgi:hypothetical protein
MAKDWKSELKDIVTSNQKTIKQVIENRDNREKERLKRIKEIMDIIKPRMEFIKELFEKDNYLISKDEVETGESVSVDQGENVAQPQPLLKPDIIQSEFIDSARRGEKVPVPTIKEDVSEILLLMPSLSEVNRLDLLYRIEFKDEKPVLHSYNLLSQGKMENNGSAHGNFEEFIQDTLKRFLLNWFKRKEGTELDKERKFELHYIARALKPMEKVGSINFEVKKSE